MNYLSLFLFYLHFLLPEPHYIGAIFSVGLVRCHMRSLLFSLELFRRLEATLDEQPEGLHDSARTTFQSSKSSAEHTTRIARDLSSQMLLRPHFFDCGNLNSKAKIEHDSSWVVPQWTLEKSYLLSNLLHRDENRPIDWRLQTYQ